MLYVSNTKRPGARWPCHVRIMFDNVNDASAVFKTFFSYLRMSFFVASAIYGDVGE